MLLISARENVSWTLLSFRVPPVSTRTVIHDSGLGQGRQSRCCAPTQPLTNLRRHTCCHSIVSGHSALQCHLQRSVLLQLESPWPRFKANQESTPMEWSRANAQCKVHAAKSSCSALRGSPGSRHAAVVKLSAWHPPGKMIFVDHHFLAGKTFNLLLFTRRRAFFFSKCEPIFKVFLLFLLGFRSVLIPHLSSWGDRKAKFQKWGEREREKNVYNNFKFKQDKLLLMAETQTQWRHILQPLL